ncbi:MAG: hypothetical protein ACH350_03680 [Parachlamydiaceae bacterium]
MNNISTFNQEQMAGNYSHLDSTSDSGKNNSVDPYSHIITEAILLNSQSPSTVNLEMRKTSTDNEALKMSENLDKLNVIATTILSVGITSSQLEEKADSTNAQDFSSLLELSISCFGEQIVEEIANKPLESIANIIFDRLNLRLSSPMVITSNEIQHVFKLLFETPLKKYASNQQDDYHPAFIFKQLGEAVKGVEVLGPDAVIPTGGDNSSAGINGSYFITNENLEKILIFKPKDEEKEGVAAGIRAGESAIREKVACLLNKQRLYPIPYTTYIELNGKVGSAQIFQKNCVGLSVLSLNPEKAHRLNVLSNESVQASLIFDIRFGNIDRHLGNLLVPEKEEGPLNLFMIDHGLCFSSSAADLLKLEHLFLPQMTEKWSDKIAEQLLEIDLEKEAKIMADHGIPDAAIDRMKRGTKFLQQVMRLSLAPSNDPLQMITPYDAGLIALKNSAKFSLDDEFDQILRLLELVISAKQLVIQDPSISIGKLRQQRMKQARTSPSLNSLQLCCIYGPLGNETGEWVDFSDSILGKLKGKLNR